MCQRPMGVSSQQGTRGLQFKPQRHNHWCRKNACSVLTLPRGIGLHLVQRFRALGEPVIATCRNVETATELKKVHGVRIEQLEVTSTESCNALYERLAKDSVELRGIVNNAGMFNKTFNVQVRDESGDVKEEERGSYTADFFDLTPEVFDQHFMVNTIGPFSVTKALRSLLTKSEKAPVVAHVSSIMGSIAESRGASNAGMYRVSKSALNMVNMLMVSALPEAACVVLHPGWVKTGMVEPPLPAGQDVFCPA